MTETVAYNWNENSYWHELTSKLQKLAKPFSDVPVIFDPVLKRWKQECSSSGVGKLLMLQNEHMAVNMTDRGFEILPFQLTGRYYGKLSFKMQEDDYKWTTHMDEENKVDAMQRCNVYEPGGHLLQGSSSSGIQFEVRTVLSPSFPFIVVELSLLSARQGKTLKITPELTWMPGEKETLNEINGEWLHPNYVDHADAFLAQNHSVTADPPRPNNGIPAGIGIAVMASVQTTRSLRNAPMASEASVILCDREFASSALEKLSLSDVILNLEAGEKSTIYVLIGAASNKTQYLEAYKRWNQLHTLQMNKEMNYWPAVLDRFSISCPDGQINAQSRYSVYNSLFSRSRTPDGLTLFVHGRPDSGYGDCAKLHQSYQMHYVALASGETASVREELLAFAALQDERGDMAKQLSPSSAMHPYAGMYSNAHFIMAVHRYISWSGDAAFLEDEVINHSSANRLSILERTKLAAEWLLLNRWEGLIAPCGWLDAWPPEVKAQAQISITAYMAFRCLADICQHKQDDEAEMRYELVYIALKQRIMEVFYHEKTGLFAEHLFESGEVAGHQIQDFWAHTQIWAALADLAPDVRGLEACRQHCLVNGIVIIPESGLFSDYISKSTDGVEDLSMGFTATWLLAAWPEITHMYALAEIRYGRINEALDAVRRQLPENLYLQNPRVSPYQYAEKYLYPHDIPWLCTWSGDPTLLQVMLEGFAGVEVNLSGIQIHPMFPDYWKQEQTFTAKFQWKGQQVDLNIDGESAKLTSFQYGEKLILGNTDHSGFTFNFEKPNVI